MDLVTPGIGLIFWSTVIFLILLWILQRYAWKPILGAVKTREKSIEEALLSAEEARKEMQNLKADNEKILKEARFERENLLKEAREIKDQIITDAKTEAQFQADKLVQQARQNIETEKQAALADLKGQVAGLSIEIAEKIIKDELSDKNRQLKMVDSLLAETNLK